MSFLCLAWLMTPFALFLCISASKALSALIIDYLLLCRLTGFLAVVTLVYATFFLMGETHFYLLYFLATPLVILMVFVRGDEPDHDADISHPNAPTWPDEPPAPDWSDDLLDQINRWHHNRPQTPSRPAVPTPTS